VKEVYLLYSGGRDSSLAAYILGQLGYEVTLVTASFGIFEAWRSAEESARGLDLPHQKLELGRAVAEEGADIIVKDGFPTRGIKFVHKRALEALAEEHGAIADGARRDDKTPGLSIDEMRALEDTRDVEYLSPLQGLGYKSIRKLAGELFEMEVLESSEMKTGDYEVELRALLKERGEETGDYFPAHEQSRVLGWKKDI